MSIPFKSTVNTRKFTKKAENPENYLPTIRVTTLIFELLHLLRLVVLIE